MNNNNNKVSYITINDACKWFKLLQNEQYKILYIKFISDDT